MIGGSYPNLYWATNPPTTYNYWAGAQYTGDSDGGYGGAPISWNQWVRWDDYGKYATGPAPTADGKYLALTYDGVSAPVTHFNRTNVKTHSQADIDANHFWRWVNVGTFIELHSCSGETVNTDIWQDDIYLSFANGKAQVELCDNGTWTSRTHCEIQYPTAWADGSITITGNYGSFSNGNTVYLYVVDSNGDQSPASDPILLGEEGVYYETLTSTGVFFIDH